MNTQDCDVLIVGSGPTGLALCAELCRQGVRSFRLIDKAVKQAEITKASGLWCRTQELLSAYPGVVETLNSRAVTVDHLSINDQVKNLANIDLNKLATESHGIYFNKIVLCEQWHTENALFKYVKSQGKSIERGIELIDFKEDSEGIYVTVQNVESNETASFKTKYLVGCDGARSFVRKKLDIPFEGETLRNGFISCHFRAKPGTMDSTATDAMTINILPSGLSFATPMPNDSWLVGGDLTPEQEKPFLAEGVIDSHGKPIQKDIDMNRLQGLLNSRGFPGLVIEDAIWISHYRINERLSNKYTNGGRIFLAGDACHAHSPLGGQGMNTGIQDAINLGWKMGLVIKGSLGASILSTYEPERIVVGKNVVDLTLRANNMMTIYNPALAKLRDLTISFASTQQFILETIVSTMSETAYSYGQSSVLSLEHWEQPPVFFKVLRRRAQNILRILTARVRGGDRMPDFHLKNGTRLHQWLTQTAGFKLLVLGGVPELEAGNPLSKEDTLKFCSSLVKKSKGIISDFMILEKDDFKDGTSAYKRIGINSQCLFLIRPDGYVGFRCEPLREELVTYYLANKALATDVIADSRVRLRQGDWLPVIVLLAAAGIGFAAYRQYKGKSNQPK
eukprot:TRINITY_DN1737_c0_g1_i1.p1 TRINITY_DN1737_c0_g1~~TRINITY_DN1737_c0_g1_i1.p1  ORF type:complete len:621 (+),score=163.51 TRINITY_DN1737_c0_g1_i1:95-1957(+)